MVTLLKVREEVDNDANGSQAGIRQVPEMPSAENNYLVQSSGLMTSNQTMMKGGAIRVLKQQTAQNLPTDGVNPKIGKINIEINPEI